MSYKITRIMARLNFIIKFHDTVLKENYYLFLRSSKLWSDVNFINTRVFALEKQEHWFKEKEDPENEKKLKESLKSYIQNLGEAQAKNLVFDELDKVFGVREFKGKFLKDTLSYIEESKRSGELTYYLHFFYRITELPELERLIKLENIELISETLLFKVFEENSKLHENYQLSKVIQHYFKSNLSKKEKKYFIQPKNQVKKKTIAVLFSDLKDFGNLVQKHESTYPDFTKELVKKYQNHCSYFIKANGGYVVQTAGDAFMAIFNLSQNVEEDLFLVLKAALGIISIPYILVNKTKFSITTRIGINIAEVEEGYIGAPDLREYTVFGKDVNIASRLEKKVDELSKEIFNFAGGILCNIDKLKEEFPPHIQKSTHDLFESLQKQIQTAPAWLQIPLINSIQENKNLLPILPSFYRLSQKVKNYIQNIKQESQLVLNSELLAIQTKEGSTQCLFIYKTLDES